MTHTRTARITLHLVEVGSTSERDAYGTITFRDYVVEARQGATRWTLGRLAGALRNGRGSWNALPIGADAWTRYHGTRRAALAALQAREDFRLTA